MTKMGPKRGHPRWGKWTDVEVDVIYRCLAEAPFMAGHASYPAAQFPSDRASATSVGEGTAFGQLCDAIADRVLEEVGEANMHVKRPLLSIAQKIQCMRDHALATCGACAELSPSALFSGFDLASFHEEPRAAPPRHAPPPCVAHGKDYVAPVRDSMQITFQTRILNAHLACALCRGYLREACTIIECLHTFCKGCIKEHFGRAHHCPTCGKDLGAKPAELVRNDRTLQSLVDRLFPCEAEGGPAGPRRGADSDAQGAGEPPAKRRARGPEPEPPGAHKIPLGLEEQADTLVRLRPLERPFFLLPAEMTVGHLAKYLLQAHGPQLPTECALQLLCHEQVLKPEWSLASVERENWNNPLQDMALTFRVAKREARKLAAAAAPAGEPADAQVGADVEEGEEEAEEGEGESEEGEKEGDGESEEGEEEGEEGEEQDEGDEAGALKPGSGSAAAAGLQLGGPAAAAGGAAGPAAMPVP